MPARCTVRCTLAPVQNASWLLDIVLPMTREASKVGGVDALCPLPLTLIHASLDRPT